MSAFAKQRPSTWILIILVLLNLSTLTLLWMQKEAPSGEFRGGQGRPDVQHFLRQELNLSDEQITQFRVLRDEHFRESRKVKHEVHKLKREILEEVFAAAPDTVKVDSLAAEIGARETKFERMLYDHFRELQTVCQIEQSDRFQALMRELVDLMKPPHGPGGKAAPRAARKPPRERRP